jgi:hypothetical protein
MNNRIVFFSYPNPITFCFLMHLDVEDPAVIVLIFTITFIYAPGTIISIRQIIIFQALSSSDIIIFQALSSASDTLSSSWHYHHHQTLSSSDTMSSSINLITVTFFWFTLENAIYRTFYFLVVNEMHFLRCHIDQLSCRNDYAFTTIQHDKKAKVRDKQVIHWATYFYYW